MITSGVEISKDKRIKELETGLRLALLNLPDSVTFERYGWDSMLSEEQERVCACRGFLNSLIESTMEDKK